MFLLGRQRFEKKRQRKINELGQGGPNPGPRATCGPRQHFLWPAENSAKNSGETARKSQ